MDKKHTIYDINGIYGEARLRKCNDEKYCPVNHDIKEEDQNTWKIISETFDVKGLPDGMDMDMYFKMMLIDKLDKIEKSLNKIANKK